MTSDFEAFARAASRADRAPGPAPVSLDRIAVLGGGPDARLLAALCLAEGAEVTLFSAYGAELDLLRAGSGIGLRGAGPIGTYHVDREGPSVRTTAELDRAVKGAGAIFLTGPIHKQRTYAMVLADHLADGQVLVVAPGRSLGAAETAWMLRIGGCRADVTLVEVLGLPFWCAAEGALLHLSPAAPMPAATLPRGRDQVLAGLMRFLPNLVLAESVLAAGFADLSAAVEIPAVTLGGAAMAPGGAEILPGGVSLPENLTFAALIGADQRAVIAGLAEERRAVARAFGVRDLPETEAWIAAFAGADRGEGARPVPERNVARSMLRDGVLGSLVPLVSAAELAGIPVPQTAGLIAMADAVLGADVAAAGRRLGAIGLTAADVDGARRAIDRLAVGGT